MPPLPGVLLAVLFWGVSFVATRRAVAELSPFTLVFARAVLGTAVLAAALAARREPVLPPRDAWRPLAGMGFIGVALHGMMQAWALTLTTAVKAGWLVGLTPVWSALLAAAALGESMGVTRVVGLAAGFTGAAVVVTGGRLGPDLLALPGTRGDLLILASGVNWAVYSVVGHGTLRRLGALRATAGALQLGMLMLLPPFVARQGWRELAALSGLGWLNVVFLGVCCSGLGYLLWFSALARVDTTRVAALLYLEPLVTLGAAAVLLGERIQPAAVAGGLLLTVGVGLVQSPVPARGRS